MHVFYTDADRTARAIRGLNAAGNFFDPDIGKTDCGPVSRSTPKWVLNKKLVGKDACYILEKAGINVEGSPRLVVVSVGRDHPLRRRSRLCQ